MVVLPRPLLLILVLILIPQICNFHKESTTYKPIIEVFFAQPTSSIVLFTTSWPLNTIWLPTDNIPPNHLEIYRVHCKNLSKSAIFNHGTRLSFTSLQSFNDSQTTAWFFKNLWSSAANLPPIILEIYKSIVNYCHYSGYPSTNIIPSSKSHSLLLILTCERQNKSLPKYFLSPNIIARVPNCDIRPPSNSFHSGYSSLPNFLSKNNNYNRNSISNTNINIYYYEINIKNNSYHTTLSADDIASPDTSLQLLIILINIIIIHHFPSLMNTQPSENIPINQVTSFRDHSSINTSNTITTYKFVAALNPLHNISLLADGTPDPVSHNLDSESDSVDEPYFSIIIGHGPISAPVPPIDPDG